MGKESSWRVLVSSRSIDRRGLGKLFFRGNFPMLSPRSKSILIVNKCVFVKKAYSVEDIHKLVCCLMYMGLLIGSV